MTKVQIIDGDFNITDPAWPRYDITRPGDVLISDDFTRTGWIGGQNTDSALGGIDTEWINARYVSQAWQVTGGQAVWNKTGTIYLVTPQQDYDLEVKIDSLPTAASDVVNIQARRTETTANYISAVVKGNGELTLKTYDGNKIEETSPASRLVNPGDLVTVRTIGDSTSVLINGDSEISKQMTSWESDRVGLNTSAAAGAKLGHIRILAL